MDDNEGATNPELISMLKMLAEDGDFESQKSLSHMYFEGEGVNKNMDQSLFWANVCVAHPECNVDEFLTISYRIGQILMKQKNYEGALKQFKFIFESKNLNPEMKDIINLSIANAYFNLNDNDKAIKIYEYLVNLDKSVIDNDNKNIICQRLGCMHMEKKDFKRSVESFNKSLELKTHIDDAILNSLGFANEMSGNFDEALKYYLLASEKDDTYANLNLGYLYDNGLGVEKDSNKAFYYYEKGKDRLEEWRISREKYKK